MYVRRWRHAAPDSYAAHYQDFYEKVTFRLNVWISNLPPSLQFSVSDLHTAVRHGNFGPLLAIHSIYHLTVMTLNRCMRRTLLPRSVVERNVQSALKLTQEYMSSIKTTLEVVASTRSPTEVLMAICPSPHFSAPIISHTILYALDILSEAGSLESSCFLQTMTLLGMGLDVLKQHPTLYLFHDNQKGTIEKRLEHLTALLHEKQHSKRAWAATSAIHHSVDVDGDDPYVRDGVVHRRAGRLLDALGFDVRDEDVMVIDDRTEEA